MLASVGSTRTRVTKRAGSVPTPEAIHVGVAAVPFVVLYSWPLLCPTQIVFAFPGVTSIALMKFPAVKGALMLVQLGPVVAVVAVVASLVRQSDAPPTSSRLALFGSSTNGAMKFACDAPQVSAITYG